MQYLYGRVTAGRGHPLPIRTELNTVDRLCVTFVGEDTPFTPNIPYLDTGIDTEKREREGVGQKRKGSCVREREDDNYHRITDHLITIQMYMYIIIIT